MAFVWTPRRVKLAIAGIGGALAALFLARKKSGEGFTDEPSPDPVPDIPPVDPYAPEDIAPATECAKPQEGAKLFRKWAIARWGEREDSPENIGRVCDDKPDEHQAGRAWDLMTINLAHGQAIVDELLAPEGSEPHALARRAGIMYLIWNKQMWRAYPKFGKSAGSWSPYSGPNPHTDHIHFSFSKAGGAGLTSLYDVIRKEFPVA